MSNILEIMYDNIKNALIIDGKCRDDSIIMSFLYVKSNARLIYLRSGSCDGSAFGEQLAEFLENDLIVQSSEHGRYQLTANYIWQREKDNLVNGGKLFDYINTKVFNTDSKKENLNERHKVVVLFLLICRAMDERTQLNLKASDVVLNRCEDLLLDVYDILKELNVITKLKKEDLFGAQGNEHKVSNLLRHTDDIPKSVISFRAPGKQVYYLDIVHDGKVDIFQLKVALQRILKCEKKLSLKETDLLCERMNNLTKTKAIYVNEYEDNPYQSIKYDKILRETLDYLYD